jgi:hypothetical protein
MVETRVEDTNPFNADSDPAFHFRADPDPAFHSSADPDLAFQSSADSDPASKIILIHADQDPQPWWILL